MTVHQSLTSAAEVLPPRVTAPVEPLPLVQAALVARRNLLETIPAAAYRDPIVAGGRPGDPWKMVLDPEAVARVLKRSDLYGRSEAAREVLRSNEGENLFTVEGEAWRWRRRAVAPAFRRSVVEALAPAMSRAAEAACDRIAARRGRPTDLLPEMARVTLDVICDTTISGGDGLERAAVARAVTRFVETVGRPSMLDMLGAPRWIPRPARVIARADRTLDRMTDKVIARRLETGPKDPPDLVDLMLAAEDPETGQAMGRVEARNNLLTFVAAGHETTALALSWALWLMAFDPAAQVRARDAARAVLAPDGRPRAAQADDLPNLAPVRAVVEEALRLYPPAAIIAREAKVHEDLCGTPVAAGDAVLIPVWSLHRHERLWDAPQAFRPERFQGTAPPRGSFVPFGDGPRICVGASFAIVEATIVLATILARFRLGLAGPLPKPVMTLTLRPEGGVWLSAEPL